MSVLNLKTIKSTPACKRILLSCFMSVICLFLVSCATTTLSNVWKDKNYHAKPGKILIIMVSKSQATRELFEGMFVAGLEARGNKAVASYEHISMDQLPDRDLVASKIKSIGADAVLVTRLVDRKTIETYDPGLMYDFPGFYNDWWGYYDYVVITPGYTDETQLLVAETNLYDIKTEKLVWSARSETEVIEGDQQLIKTFVKVVIDRLSADGLIK